MEFLNESNFYYLGFIFVTSIILYKYLGFVNRKDLYNMKDEIMKDFRVWKKEAYDIFQTRGFCKLKHDNLDKNLLDLSEGFKKLEELQRENHKDINTKLDDLSMNLMEQINNSLRNK